MARIGAAACNWVSCRGLAVSIVDLPVTPESGMLTGEKLRFRFAKTGHLRLLSHHDMMRCLERMLRRAEIPFKSTAGFHPSPRLVFALSLPLGVEGKDEVIELELTRPCEPQSVCDRFNEFAPVGLRFLRVRVVPMKATAIPRRMIYTLCLPASTGVLLPDLISGLLAQDKIWVDRFNPSPKRLNIRPYVRSLGLGPVENGTTILSIDLWVTQTGTAKAEELVRLLGLSDVTDAGAVLERSLLEIRDEVTDSLDSPPDGPAETLPPDPAVVAARIRAEKLNQTPGSVWGASPNGPVVE